MTIGSKKFKQLEQKLEDAGFYDYLKDSYDANHSRKSSEMKKINMKRAAKELGIEYMSFRSHLNKGGRMSDDWFSKINDKLEGLSE